MLVVPLLAADSEQAPESRLLEWGKPIEREIAGGQSHLYRTTLAAGQYLVVIAEQNGIDLVMSAFGPDGKKLAEVDSPNGAVRSRARPLDWRCRWRIPDRGEIAG